MADGLAAAILGGSPLGGDILGLQQGQQLTNVGDDPSKWADLGWGGALAHALTGVVGPSMAQGAAQRISGAYQAALPDLAAAYKADDPFQWAASNPDASPLARWTILNQSPDQVAATKERIARTGYTNVEAAKAGLGLPAARSELGKAYPDLYGGAGAGAGAGAGGGQRGAAPGVAPGLATGPAAGGVAAPFQFPGRPQPPGGGDAGDVGAAAAPATDPMAAQRDYFRGLNPTQQRAYYWRMKAQLEAQRAAAAQPQRR
jgi:hypothetical protein